MNLTEHFQQILETYVSVVKMGCVNTVGYNESSNPDEFKKGLDVGVYRLSEYLTENLVPLFKTLDEQHERDEREVIALRDGLVQLRNLLGLDPR